MGRIEQLEQFIAKNPADPFPRYGLAIELKNGGRLEDAARQFSELMTRFPDYTAAYLHAGNVLRDLGRRDEAAATYRSGIEACMRRGDGHARGELEAALAALEEGPEAQFTPDEDA
jgi:tetratricopeptide (TPR) repeat protein